MHATPFIRVALVASTLALVACPAPTTPETGTDKDKGGTTSVKKSPGPKATGSAKPSSKPGGEGTPKPTATPTGSGTTNPNATTTPTATPTTNANATATPGATPTPTPAATATATSTPAAGAGPTAAPNLPAGSLIVETFAGSTATATFQKDPVALAAATFNKPRGLALGPDGAIYVADTGSHAIRKIKDGMVSTVIGTGVTTSQNDPLTLNAPADLAVDADGTLYIADTLNHRVRKLRPGAVELDFLCGNGNAGFLNGTGDGSQLSNPVGVALDGKGGLWISDAGNHAIRKVKTATGELTTLAGKKEDPNFVNGAGTAARFMDPARCFALGDALFVADSNNDAVRKVLADGTTSTVADTALAIRGASSVTSHVDASLLVLGAGSLAIMRFTGPTASTAILAAGNGAGLAEGPIASAKFGSLDDVLVLPSGEILIADGVNNRIRKIKAGS